MIMDSPVSPTECEGDARKRVCKACDRCRIKKSKCDGKKPCGRCRNDDAICVFGGRKKKTDRVHPKGYVEILERQQRQLVKGIRALYDRQLGTSQWTGPLPQNGYPPTHEILEYLGALELEESSEDEDLEENTYFEESVHHLRRSIKAKEDASQITLAGTIGSPLASQHNLLQNQQPRDYFGNKQPAHPEDIPSIPSLSPDSQSNARHSSSTSLDEQNWITNEWSGQSLPTSLPPDRGFSSGLTPALCYGSDLDECLMQDAFEDQHLLAPWKPNDDFGGFPYPRIPWCTGRPNFRAM